MTTGAQTHWRVFCAIDLPERVKSRVAEHVSNLRRDFPGVRASWEKTEKLHFTLKFLGDVETERIKELSHAAERAASSLEAFDLTIAEPGTFPPHGPARVLWLGVKDDSGSLARLHQSLEDTCSAAGFSRESRPFKPHLTLARIRTPHGTHELAAAHRAASFTPQTFTVSEIVLMRSELGPGGSRYTPLSHCRMGSCR